MSHKTEKSNLETLGSREALLEVLAVGGSIAGPSRVADRAIPSAVVIEGDGTRYKSLEHLLEKPAVLRSRVELLDVDSFVAYVNRFARRGAGASAHDDTLALFADIDETSVSFTGIIDYHSSRSLQAERGAHRVFYRCAPTPEWRRWTESNGRKMSQEEFAQFIEDNAPEMVAPSSAQMMEIALSLEARTTGEFKQATRLENGALSFRYSESIDAKAGLNGDLEIPAEFEIGVAPFVGFSAFRVKARLRYRLNSGKLILWYELVRPHKIIEECGREALAKVTEGTGITPFLGAVNSMGMEGAGI